MSKKYIVRLEVDEREKLLALISSGTSKARTLTHARILLKANEGWQNEKICEVLEWKLVWMAKNANPNRCVSLLLTTITILILGK